MPGSIARAVARGGAPVELLRRFETRRIPVTEYPTAYRRYCWDVDGIDDLRLAPFHLLATEGKVHIDQDHVCHMEKLATLCAADPRLLLATPYLVVDLLDDESVARGIAWWEELTAKGGEGMLVKPRDWLARGKRGLVQPAV